MDVLTATTETAAAFEKQLIKHGEEAAAEGAGEAWARHTERWNGLWDRSHIQATPWRP